MISTHILDTSLGMPAADVVVMLEKKVGNDWTLIGTETTNNDGRISFACPAESGTFRLQFQIESYFKRKNLTPFFLSAPVIFQINDTNRKYHIPLLLNPYGYSTYRGS